MNKTYLTAVAILAATISFSSSVGAENQPETVTQHASPPMPMAGGRMPMMGGPQGRMPMMHGQGEEMPMMGGPGGMLNPQMMQQMMAMRLQHMQTMETHLANIEALLQQLVELQKQ